MDRLLAGIMIVWLLRLLVECIMQFIKITKTIKTEIYIFRDSGETGTIPRNKGYIIDVDDMKNHPYEDFWGGKYIIFFYKPFGGTFIRESCYTRFDFKAGYNYKVEMEITCSLYEWRKKKSNNLEGKVIRII